MISNIIRGKSATRSKSKRYRFCRFFCALYVKDCCAKRGVSISSIQYIVAKKEVYQLEFRASPEHSKWLDPYMIMTAYYGRRRIM